jgi:WD40 repeat protein
MTVAFSPNGTQIISGSCDCTLRIWECETGQVMGDPLRGHKDWIEMVMFSLNGLSITSCSTAGDVIKWEVKGKTFVRKEAIYPKWPYRLGFTPISNGRLNVIYGVPLSLKPIDRDDEWIYMYGRKALWMPGMDCQKYRMEYIQGTLVLWHNMDLIIIRV